MAGIGLPLLNGFVSEFLTVLGTFSSPHLGVVYGSLASLGMILGAIYMLSMMGRVLFGPIKVPSNLAGATATGDLNLREILALSPLAVLVIVLGIFPTPVLHSLRTSVTVIPGYIDTTQQSSKSVVLDVKTREVIQLTDLKK